MPGGQESAGIAIVQAFNHQYHIERALVGGKQCLQLLLYTADYKGYPFLPGFEAKTKRQIITSIPYEKDEVILKIQGTGKKYTFFYGESEKTMIELHECDGTLINTEQVGCMVGTMIGIYATGHGKNIDNAAQFDWFELDQQR